MKLSFSARRRMFRLLHHGLYHVAVPVLSRTGPVEPAFRRIYRSIAKEPSFTADLPYPLEVDGLELWYDRERPSFTVRGLAMGTYERSTIALLRSSLERGMNVVDVGAHIGYHTLVCAELVGPQGCVWSFEPDPDNRRLLAQNIAANGCGGCARVVPQAAGTTCATSTLFRFQSDTGSSSVFERKGRLIDALPTDVTTLDRWGEGEGWPPVDLVKMDIEGSEVAALAGMAELSRRNPSMKLIVELNPEALEAAGESPQGLLEAIATAGFPSVSLIDDDQLQPMSNASDVLNVIRRARWEPVNLFCRR